MLDGARAAPPPTPGTTTATPPSAPRATSRTCPSSNLQAFYKRSTTSPTTRCWWWPASSTRRRRFEWVADSFGRHPQARSARCPSHLHRGAGAGRREARSPCAAWAARRCWTIGYHVPAGTDPDFAAIDVLTDVLGDAPSGPPLPGAGRRQEGRQGQLQRLPAEGARLLPAARRSCAPATRSRRAPGSHLDVLENVEPASPSPPTRSSGPSWPTCSSRFELLLNHSTRVGLALSEAAAMGDWRMLFCTATAAGRHRRRREPGGVEVLQGVEPHDGRVRAHREARPRRDSSRGRPWPRC